MTDVNKPTSSFKQFQNAKLDSITKTMIQCVLDIHALRKKIRKEGFHSIGYFIANRLPLWILQRYSLFGSLRQIETMQYNSISYTIGLLQCAYFFVGFLHFNPLLTLQNISL